MKSRSTSRIEWKVGLFVFIGLVLLGLLLLQFSKGTTFFRQTKDILLHANNVSGLKVRAAVLMSGVQVGSVADIKLAPEGTNVTITLRIYSEYQIHGDARFIIEMSGFLGDQFVAILATKNQGPVLQNGDTAEAEVPFSILEAARSANGFLLRIQDTASNLDNAISRIDRLVLNDTTLTNLSAAVINIRLVSETARATVSNLNALVTTNSPLVTASLTNLALFSSQLQRSASSLDSLLATNGAKFSEAMKNVESAAVVLKNLLDDVQAGKGTAGSLLKNEQLATNVAQIAYNLSITTSNLNRLGLWGILWQHKPAKTAAAAPPTPASAPKNSSD